MDDERMNNNINHKHIELLSYYLSRDIKRIENKIKRDEYALLGYFIASIVDVLIVVIFEEYIKSIAWYYKVAILLGLVILYVAILKLFNCIHKECLKKQIIAGRDLLDDESVERMVDEFDNIAVDGLLLCYYYMDQYKKEMDVNVKQLCLYETLHYLDKSCRVFRRIANDYVRYVSEGDNKLISAYRIDNYLSIAESVVGFLKERKGDEKTEFANKVENLSGDVCAWKKMREEKLKEEGKN